MLKYEDVWRREYRWEYPTSVENGEAGFVLAGRFYSVIEMTIAIDMYCAGIALLLVRLVNLDWQ